MVAQKQDTALIRDCKVECRENPEIAEHQYVVTGTFQIQISSTFDVHELDQIESEIEQAGQEFKRQATRHVLKTADCRIAGLPKLPKLPTRIFTSTARVPSPSSQDTAM